MYYEEEIIDGVLMWRGSPDGEWQPVSGVAEQYVAQKAVIAELEREAALARDMVVNAEKLVRAAQSDYYEARRRIAALESALRPFAENGMAVSPVARTIALDILNRRNDGQNH